MDSANRQRESRVLRIKSIEIEKNHLLLKSEAFGFNGLPLDDQRKMKFVKNKQVYQNKASRIAVEHGFSQLKFCFGIVVITTKCKDTALSSFALSVTVLNLSKIAEDFLRPFFV